MGTITTRQRKDGTEAHTVQIRIKRGGKVVHTEAETFDRMAAAKTWMKLREAELAKPGALDGAASHKNPTLAEVIVQYQKESLRDHGSTKKQVLRSIAASELGALRCSQVTSQEIVKYAQSLEVQPQTVGNYMSHLASVIRVAKPAWGYPLDMQAMTDARTVLDKLGAVSRSRQRDRRPSLAELEALLQHFKQQKARNSAVLPMEDIVLFAMFSSRRQDEITRVVWADLDPEHAELTVRDMKHPGQKNGNDVRTKLPDAALAVVLRQPRVAGKHRIFPFNTDSISAAFSRACQFLAIEDLHFHDLRHECVSWLFELGWNIPQVAMVSGHRSWNSLKRYTQIRKIGDKYADWAWLPKLPAGEAVPAA